MQQFRETLINYVNNVVTTSFVRSTASSTTRCVTLSTQCTAPKPLKQNNMFNMTHNVKSQATTHSKFYVIHNSTVPIKNVSHITQTKVSSISTHSLSNMHQNIPNAQMQTSEDNESNPRPQTSIHTQTRTFSHVSAKPLPLNTQGMTLTQHLYKISVLSLNVCGLRSKLLFSEFIILIRDYDIVCMCETRCDDVDMEDVKVTMEDIGFGIIYKNRHSLSRFKSGGMLIAISNRVTFKWKQIRSDHETLLSVCINGRSINLEKDFMITCTYIPPSHSRYGKPEHFDELDDLFLSYNDYYHFVSGDFNAHTGTMSEINQFNENDEYTTPPEDIYVTLRSLGCSVRRFNKDVTPDRTSYGKKLVDVCRNNNVIIFNGRLGEDCGEGNFTTTYNTTIDYGLGTWNIVKFVKNFKILNFDPLCSDVHRGLDTRLEFKCVAAGQATECVKQEESVHVRLRPGKWRDEKKSEYVRAVDVSKVNELIENLSEMSVDDVCKQLKCVLIEPALNVFPRCNSRKYIKKSNNANMPGYDKQCYNSRKEYHKAKSKYNKHKNSITYTSMLQKSKKYKNDIKRAKNKETASIHKQLRENKNKDPKTYWKILKSKQATKQHQISLDKFYDHFKLLFTENDNMNETINYDINSDANLPILNDPITLVEIRTCIKKLKNGKSPGNDDIINEYIKNTQDLLCPLYVKLFNKILDSGVFPTEWLTGVIVPLYKNKGEANDTNNYRGITLLSCMGKLFTSVLNDRLKLFSDTNCIITEAQAGFREGYSTLDHMLLLTWIIDLFKWKGRKLFCLFVDYQKAFDTVWREGLWFKLVRANINGKIINVIRSMYYNVKSCVMVEQNVSDSFSCNMGVRQGENLSPLLFAFYVNDLQDYLIEQNCNYLKFNDEFVDVYLKLLVLMYADDTIILCDSEKNMKQALVALHSYCLNWKLKVNCSKTKIVIFSRGRVRTNNFMFQFGEEEIEVVGDYKYLGMLFNYNGRSRKGQLALKDNATKAMYAVVGTSRKYDLPIDIQLEMYNSMVMPVMLYGCEVWGNYAIRELELLQMKFCKYVLYVHRYTSTDIVYGELGIYPVEVMIKCRIMNYWYRLIVGKSTKLCHVMYLCLLRLYQSGIYLSPWLTYIRSICIECGLSGVWLSQTIENPKWFKLAVEQRLKDLWLTTWYRNMSTKNICSSYRVFKEGYGIEDYLVKLCKNNRIYISKLRAGNNKLPIITGRYQEVAREERFCNKCNGGYVGDEYHVLLECQNQEIVLLRNRYIPIFFRVDPNQSKLVRLMQSKNTDILNNLSYFIREVLKLFR